MTPRTLARAARDIYDDLASREARADEACAPERACTPASASSGSGAAPLDATGLMARARDLYEDSVLPVRLIAAEIGVSERTIYKYAVRLGWRPRYCWPDDSVCMRGRGWRAAGPFAPAKGAGARFVRREARDEPVVRGLKATDPAARAEAEAACAEAARRAHLATLTADWQFAYREHGRAFRAMNAAMDELGRFRNGPRARTDKTTERRLLEHLQAQIDILQGVRIAAQQCRARLEAARAQRGQHRR